MAGVLEMWCVYRIRYHVLFSSIHTRILDAASCSGGNEHAGSDGTWKIPPQFCQFMLNAIDFCSIRVSLSNREAFKFRITTFNSEGLKD